MKKTNLILAIFVLSGIVGIIHAQTNAQLYEVATWQGFRKAAVSYTFDDNCPNQLAVAIPLFNEFDFKATLFIPSAWIKEWSGLQLAADKGHEIASHTVTHANLGNLTIAQQLSEFKNSQQEINAHINGHSCNTIAYPFCVPGNDSLCSSYYIAARHCQGYIEPKTPSDFLKISSMATGTMSSIQTVQQFNYKVEKADSLHGWCVFLIHGIDNDGGYSPTQSAVLKAHLEYMKQHGDRFWVATFGEVVRYIRERNAVTVKEISKTKTSITIQVTDNLDNAIYNYPVTIKRVLPKNWKSPTIVQCGQKIKTTLLKKGRLSYLIFDVVPDNGELIISK